MAMNGLISRRRLSDGSIDGLDLSSSSDLQHKVHVLAVDDSPVDRKTIERLLKISACKVTAVDSGRRALQFLGLDDEERDSSVVDGLKVDLVITDYCMPGMTGYELLKKIKESTALRDTPVVIMSSENVHTRIDRCIEGGAEGFILKPVTLGDVRRLMKRREDRFKDAMDMAVATGVVVGVHKRKSRDDGSEFSSKPPVPLQPPASPPSPFPLSSNSPPSSPDSPLSLFPASSDSLVSEMRPSTARSSSAESPSSTSGELDFPTRKIELTLRDDHEIVPDSKL